MKKACENCAMYYRLSAGAGDCRLNPIPQQVDWNYWCAQFRPKNEGSK